MISYPQTEDPSKRLEATCETKPSDPKHREEACCSNAAPRHNPFVTVCAFMDANKHFSEVRSAIRAGPLTHHHAEPAPLFVP